MIFKLERGRGRGGKVKLTISAKTLKKKGQYFMHTRIKKKVPVTKGF